jgi:hypothetical protein
MGAKSLPTGCYSTPKDGCVNISIMAIRHGFPLEPSEKQAHLHEGTIHMSNSQIQYILRLYNLDWSQ